MSWKTKKRCKSLKYLCCSKELTGQESFHDWSSCDNYWSTNEETFQQILANLRTLTWWESVSALLIYVSSAIWANVRTFATISGFIFLHSDLFSSGKSGLAYNICPQSTKGLWLELEIVQMFRPPWGHFDEDEDWHRQCWVLDSGRVALEMFQMSVLPHLRNIQLWPCQYEIAPDSIEQENLGRNCISSSRNMMRKSTSDGLVGMCLTLVTGCQTSRFCQ